ncbi:MAG: ferrous iron transport protein B [Intestinibacter bartlettii]|uniref:ferrous iron transport protein B n=1 Tax=Intestinibacter bartlettii TaxID=261299 RepID=UPI0026EF448F|nr:ferrous iron transport protein B [Intestinibacter bartlettii]MDO5009204.1 ferrous iron transport protein B [Intestinibacter bartlettii]
MINVALFGNPNVGKTTVFNLLTGSNQYVGNWPGVTIEKKEGYLKEDIKIVDLPGIYAMDTFSNEEKVSKSFLENEDVDVILNIVDASNLSRNLYLTTQLMKYNKPIILLLNMLDLADSKGIQIDYDKLAEELGIQIIPIIAKRKSGTENIEQVIRNSVGLKTSYIEDFGTESETYEKIDSILTKCTIDESKGKKTITDKIDDFVLNPILAYPIFIGILFLLFKFTFDWVGGPLQDLSTTLIEDYIIAPVDGLLASSSPWFKSLIVDGILGSLGGTLPFFPLIFVLFLGISLFEDSGYMSRAAFLMDKIMSRVGLSGKAFIPMVMGMGCASPAIMATRTLESEKDRKITALISPLMTCGAKLSIYALFIKIFFKDNAAIITTSLYLLGIVVAILVALILNKTVYKTELEPFVLELPEYRVPTLDALLKNAWNKSKGFLYKVVTVMFFMSVIIWAMSSFNFGGFTEDINTSFLSYLGKAMAPIFAPLGFNDWRISVALITGLGAKEVVVNTLLILFGNLNAGLTGVFTFITAYTFLVFCALYTPCIATLATMRKEYGNKMMFASLFYQFGLAWIVGFSFNFVGSLIAFGETGVSIGQFASFVVVIIFTVLLLNYYSKNNKLNSATCDCSSCKSKCSQGSK